MKTLQKILNVLTDVITVFGLVEQMLRAIADMLARIKAIGEGAED